MGLENVLLELVRPLCNHPESLEVESAENEDGKEVVLTIKATSSDIGHLIGKKGAMAQSIRSMMSVASILAEKRLSIKFDTVNQ